MPSEISKQEFIERYLRGDLERWMGQGPRTVASFLYSVEEWACQRQGEVKRRETHVMNTLVDVARGDSGILDTDAQLLRDAVLNSDERPSDKEIELLVMGDSVGEPPTELQEKYPQINAALDKIYR